MKRRTDICSCCSQLFALLLLVVVAAMCPCAKASVRPDYFVRIASPDELTAEDVCLVGAVLPQDGRLYLMSQNTLSNQLEAILQDDVMAGAAQLTCTDPACLWSIVTDKNGHVVVKSYPDGDALYNKKGSSLELSETKVTPWTVSVTSDGALCFTNADERALSLYFGGEGIYKFGSYKAFDSNRLYLFKGVSSAITDDERARPLPDGSMVCLSGGGLMSAVPFGAMPDNGLLLADGTVCPDEGVGTWTYNQLPDSCFTLTDVSGQYWGYNLRPTAEKQIWSMSGGYMMTCEDTPRLLCVADSFVLKLRSDIKYDRPVRLRLLGSTPGQTLHEGRLSLSGAWSARRLNALDWGGAQLLDLTALHLPITGLTSLGSRPKTTNTFIYIASSAVGLIPSSWPGIVTCGDDGNKLLTAIELIDRSALPADVDFTFEKGQLSYRREVHADGNWETLMLPFRAALPSNFSAQGFTELKDDALCFDAVSEVAAYAPVIVRFSGKATTVTVPFVVTALNAGRLHVPPTSNAIFIGTLSPVSVSSAAENVYLLNAEGTAFRLSDRGSALAPFRAYIHLADVAHTLRLQTDSRTTSLHHIATNTDSIGTTARCYTIDGRPVSSAHLVPGCLYVREGKGAFIK